MKLTSVFENNQPLPVKYSKDAKDDQGKEIDVNPPLTISEAPEGTQSFALVERKVLACLRATHRQTLMEKILDKDIIYML